MKEKIRTVWFALRYSLAFCLRNNRSDTLFELRLTLYSTLVSYGLIRVYGALVSVLQSHYANVHSRTFTLVDFFKSDGFVKIALFYVVLKFLMITIQEYKSPISRRRDQILRAASEREKYAKRSELDIGRIRSKEFANLRQRINDLPQGWYTRISFAREALEVVSDMITFAVFGAAIAFSNPGYFVILLVACAPMIVTRFSIQNRLQQLNESLLNHHKIRDMYYSAFYSNSGFVQGLLFNQLKPLLKLIRKGDEYETERFDEVRKSNTLENIVTQYIATAGFCVVFFHASWKTLSTGGDLGTLTVLIATSERMVGSLRGIFSQIAAQWVSARGMVMIEREYFGMQPLVLTPHPVEPQFAGPMTIRVEKLCARYPDKDRLVLKDVSFIIRGGEKVVIVGRNGSGKSTLVSMLLRLMDPHSGSVFVGDLDLRQLAPQTWYRYVAALLQSYVIHDRTIGDEIASCDLESPKDMGKVERAARFAEFMKVIESRVKGFDEQLGEQFGGESLSGGEEHRLAIARVYCKGAPVFMLDEPEVNLDAEAARKIMGRLFKLEGATVIAVVHDLSYATLADRVLFMDEGVLSGNGTHDELMESSPRYRSLFLENEKDKDIVDN